MKQKPVLVIMAAGIGSRYGAGIKQLAKVGPSGEIIMDYSLYDAREAGCEKVVFIIRKDLEEEFREIIGDRIAKEMEVAYAFQETDDLPEGFACPPERKKPWGTGHAILAAAKVVDGPFCVINADDYYGKKGYKLIYDYLTSQDDTAEGPERFVMAGFIVKNTLSDNGVVTRGICLQNEKGELTEIHETKNIARGEDGIVRGDYEGKTGEIDPEGLVSMNMWGFTGGLWKELKEGFPKFLTKALAEDPLKAEYLLPTIVDDMLKAGKATVAVLPDDDTWFGITYQADRQAVADDFARMVEEGVYPSPLFGKKRRRSTRRK